MTNEQAADIYAQGAQLTLDKWREQFPNFQISDATLIAYGRRAFLSGLKWKEKNG